MIKVIVADDEIRVCQLICNIVDWSLFNMQIVATAHNGIEAIKLVEAEKPDLLITDINMPGCDGLELIERLKSSYPEIEIIIISGHGDFNYAQKAIKFAVSDYLLKPLSKKDLSLSLQKMQEKFKLKKQYLSIEQELHIRKEQDLHYKKISFLKDIIKYNKINAEQLKDLPSFNGDVFCCVIIKIDWNQSTIKAYDIVNDKLDKITSSHFAKFSDAFLYNSDDMLYCLINLFNNEKEDLSKTINNILIDLKEIEALFKPLIFTIAMSEIIEGFEDIPNSFKQAQQALNQRIFLPNQKLIIWKQQKYSAIDLQNTSGMQNAIISALDNLNPAIAESSITEWKSIISKNINIDGKVFYETINNIYYDFFYEIKKHEIKEIIINIDEFVYESSSINYYENLIDYFKNCIVDDITNLKIYREKRDKLPIRKAREYIKSNYMNQINLDDIAKQVGFNSSYFSSLFKKESGMNFQEYLIKVRMDKARELLTDTNLSIAQICQDVGYSDRKHFSQSFKRLFGLQPKEYRKLYS